MLRNMAIWNDSMTVIEKHIFSHIIEKQGKTCEILSVCPHLKKLCVYDKKKKLSCFIKTRQFWKFSQNRARGIRSKL